MMYDERWSSWHYVDFFHDKYEGCNTIINEFCALRASDSNCLLCTSWTINRYGHVHEQWSGFTFLCRILCHKDPVWHAPSPPLPWVLTRRWLGTNSVLESGTTSSLGWPLWGESTCWCTSPCCYCSQGTSKETLDLHLVNDCKVCSTHCTYTSTHFYKRSIM